MNPRKNWRWGVLCLICAVTLQPSTMLAQDQSPDGPGDMGAQQGAAIANPGGDVTKANAPVPVAEVTTLGVPVGAVPNELNILGPVLGTSGALR